MSKGQQAEAQQLALMLDGRLHDSSVPSDLRALADLAAAVRVEIHVAEPDPAFRDALRRRLLTAPEPQAVAAPRAATGPGVMERIRATATVGAMRLRDSVRVAVATGLASMMIGSTGVAVASQQALPTDLLYPVKQATESVRLTLASSQESRGRLRLQFAEERLEEVTAGANDLPTDVLIATLDAMDRDALRGSNDLLEVAAQSIRDELHVEALLTELRDFAQRQREGLDSVAAIAPVVASPFFDRSAEVLRRIEVRATETLDPCAACTEPTEGSDSPEAVPTRSTAVLAPGEGPAVIPAQPCECPPLSEPAPPRVSLPLDIPALPLPAQPLPEPLPAVPPATTAPAPPPREPEADERVLVPPLPIPLDPVGRGIDDLLGGLLDEVGGVVDPDEPTDVLDPVTDVLDLDLGGLLDPPS